jgi:hypothetical protein
MVNEQFPNEHNVEPSVASSRIPLKLAVYEHIGHDGQPPIKPFGLLCIKKANECLIKTEKNEIKY